VNVTIDTLVATTVTGFFSWEADERISSRYGAFGMYPSTHNEKDMISPSFNSKALQALKYQRVRMTATVIRTFPSGHIGDFGLGIFPSTPKVGEVVDLGVGTFEGFEERSFRCGMGLSSIILRPNDGRSVLWIDPRNFYRLHDQVVTVLIEPTDAEFSLAPNLLVRGVLGT
jgi:hypothetical protein